MRINANPARTLDDVKREAITRVSRMFVVAIASTLSEGDEAVLRNSLFMLKNQINDAQDHRQVARLFNQALADHDSTVR